MCGVTRDAVCGVTRGASRHVIHDVTRARTRDVTGFVALCNLSSCADGDAKGERDSLFIGAMTKETTKISRITAKTKHQ